MAETGIGAAVRRKEDYRFLTGKGNYTDDINRSGQVYAYFVRSTRPHAKLKSINAKTTKAAPGVVGVFTGDDLAADGVGGIPCAFAPDGGPMNEPPRPALAQGHRALRWRYGRRRDRRKPGASEGCRRAA